MFVHACAWVCVRLRECALEYACACACCMHVCMCVCVQVYAEPIPRPDAVGSVALIHTRTHTYMQHARAQQLLWALRTSALLRATRSAIARSSLARWCRERSDSSTALASSACTRSSRAWAACGGAQPTCLCKPAQEYVCTNLCMSTRGGAQPTCLYKSGQECECACVHVCAHMCAWLGMCPRGRPLRPLGPEASSLSAIGSPPQPILLCATSATHPLVLSSSLVIGSLSTAA